MLMAHDRFAAAPSTQSRSRFCNTLTSVLSSRIHQFTNFLSQFSCVRNTSDEVETAHRPTVGTQIENFRAQITADALIKISYQCMTKDSSNSFLNRLHTLADMPDPMAALEETLTSKNKGQDVRRDVMASLSALTNVERCTDSTKDMKTLANIALNIQALASNFDKKYAWLSDPTAFINDNSASKQEKIAFVADFSQQMRDLKIKLDLYFVKESAQEDSGYNSPGGNTPLTMNSSLTDIHVLQE